MKFSIKKEIELDVGVVNQYNLTVLFYRLKDTDFSQSEFENIVVENNDKELNAVRSELKTLKEHSTEEINKLVQNHHQELDELR